MRKHIALSTICVMLLSSAAGAAEWYEKIKVGGDFRYRSEMIKREFKEDDSRDRIRARFRVTGEASESWSVGLGLATGSDDPVSTNTTLTGGYSRKGIMLDLAYLDFHPKAVAGLSLVAGKMNLPFEVAEKTELMWDNDLTPEGLAFRYRRGAGARTEIFLNGAVFDIRDTDPDDLGEAWMLGGQAGLDAKLPSGVGLTVGAGYFNYEGAIGRYGFYRPNEFYGNTTRLWLGTTEIGGYSYYYRGYARDFNIVEALGVVDFGLREWADVALYGTYVNNVRADDQERRLARGRLGEPRPGPGRAEALRELPAPRVRRRDRHLHRLGLHRRRHRRQGMGARFHMRGREGSRPERDVVPEREEHRGREIRNRIRAAAGGRSGEILR